MPNKYSSGKFSIAECDICGQRYKLKQLRKLVVKQQIKNIERESMEDMLDELPDNIKKMYLKSSLECKDGLEGEIVALADIIDRLIYLYIELNSVNSLSE
jgi:hypothetical protein